MSESGQRAERFYLDANILIYAVEGDASYRLRARALIISARRKGISLCTSELTVGECLIGAYRTAGSAGVESYQRSFFDRPDRLILIPATLAVIKGAAEIGSASRMKLIDSIHVASAREAGCVAIVTNDKGIVAPAGIAILPFW